jgi:hypothetical protein
VEQSGPAHRHSSKWWLRLLTGPRRSSRFLRGLRTGGLPFAVLFLANGGSVRSAPAIPKHKSLTRLHLTTSTNMLYLLCSFAEEKGSTPLPPQPARLRECVPVLRSFPLAFNFESLTSNSSLSESPDQSHSIALTLPLFSCSYALFCAVQNGIPNLFYAFRTLCAKHGGGVPGAPQTCHPELAEGSAFSRPGACALLTTHYPLRTSTSPRNRAQERIVARRSHEK